MANQWKTNDISFEGTEEQGVIELGKTHDLMPVRLDKKDEDAHTKFVKESLPPWMTHPDKETMNWEHRREKNLLDLRNHPTYQFVMLVSSFSNEPMERYWIAPSEANSEHTSKSMVGNTKGPVCRIDKEKDKNDANVAFHKLYIDDPVLNGIIFLSPSIYAHIEESYVAITQVHSHLSKVPLSLFVNTPKIRTLFAKLVALCIRSSDFLSQKRYNLDSTFPRINMEKRRLMNYFAHVKHRSNTLMYFHQRSGKYVDTVPARTENPFQIDSFDRGNEDLIFKASMRLAVNNNY
tara:strand:- start:7416 stop:8291 length:876 start_codon:yes stop_codon:yes gene_type:complete